MRCLLRRPADDLGRNPGRRHHSEVFPRTACRFGWPPRSPIRFRFSSPRLRAPHRPPRRGANHRDRAAEGAPLRTPRRTRPPPPAPLRHPSVPPLAHRTRSASTPPGVALSCPAIVPLSDPSQRRPQTPPGAHTGIQHRRSRPSPPCRRHPARPHPPRPTPPLGVDRRPERAPPVSSRRDSHSPVFPFARPRFHPRLPARTPRITPPERGGASAAGNRRVIGGGGGFSPLTPVVGYNDPDRGFDRVLRRRASR